MTANAGYKAYATGDVLTAAQVQYNLQNQTVMYFATTTARDTALSAVKVEGMVSYTPATGVMVYNGTAWVAVGATLPSQTGNSGKYLTTDGTNTSWGAVSGGGLTLISDTVLASGTTGFNLTSIPSTYKQLLLVYGGIYHQTAEAGFQIRVNNDSGSTAYAGASWGASAGAVANSAWSGSDYINTGDAASLFGFAVTGGSGTSYQQVKGTMLIDNYSSTTLYKQIRGDVSFYAQGNGYQAVKYNYDWWNTAAINQINVFRSRGTGTMASQANTSIRLYGIS